MCTASKTGCWLQNNHGEPLNVSMSASHHNATKGFNPAELQGARDPMGSYWASSGLLFLPHARAKELQLMLAGEFLPLQPSGREAILFFLGLDMLLLESTAS